MKFNLDTPETSSEEKQISSLSSTITSTPRPTVSELTKAIKHGGAYSLLDQGLMVQRFDRLKGTSASFKALNSADLAGTIANLGKNLFYLILPDKEYVIQSSLMHHITSPAEGRTFSIPGETDHNRQIPTFLTFVGQFIDHDLTLNMVELIVNPGQIINNNNVASPFIDLDSVYGNREALFNGEMTDIFNQDGTFKLRQIGRNAYDLARDEKGLAFIFDARNDENQIIMQMHVLLMRLHNKIAATYSPPTSDSIEDLSSFIEEIKLEVQRNWQSFVLNEYLPALINEETLNYVLAEIQKEGYGALLHKPTLVTDGDNEYKLVGMPHEFSIGFRMGHTQLRDGYHLNPKFDPIVLFDNSSAEPNDLRGDRPLQDSHVIDWAYFANSEASGEFSNKIDAKVTSKVFNLPPTAIPDSVKDVGNLPHRNLIRSKQVKISSGEEIAEVYNLPDHQVLTPDEIEPDKEKQKLFKLGNNGVYSVKNQFRTPLWYYVIKEAEIKCGGEQLGPLGGRIVAEVIAGGIYYLESSFVHDESWKSKITGSRNVSFNDIINFVNEAEEKEEAK